MKKSGFFRGMFDGLRSTVSQPTGGSKSEFEIEEQIRAQHFQVAKIVRHGFPYQPTALAFDPIQRLIAIGTKNGSLRLLGRPGVDIHVQHVPEYPVIQIIFIMNEGSLITLCADDSIHLWNLRSKPPEIVHSLKFQKERSRKTHPGSIVHLSDCPIDSNKLLIGFDCGSIVMWDLRNKSADFRHHYSEGLRSISWHHEGRQFICSHNDGSLATWNIRGSNKPVSIVHPHAKVSKDDLKLEPCNAVYKVEWKTVRNSDSFVIFSGGLPYSTTNTLHAQTPPSSSTSSSSPIPKLDKMSGTQTLTVIHGKATTVLEMEHNIIDFVTLCEAPWESDFNEPYAIVVLLYNDLVVVDLTTPGYPCFQNPYSMDLHESPVTYCLYIADCPSDLIPAFYSVGYRGNKRSGFSDKEWPISGGEWGTSTLSYPEIIITGHADGSLKFWDASSVNLQVLYKLKTGKIFDKPKVKNNNTSSSETSQQQTESNQENDDPFAIEQVVFCSESRYLCVAGASSHIIVFRFIKQETHTDVTVLEIPMKYDEIDHDASHSETEISSGIGSLLITQGSSEVQDNSCTNLKVKSGHHKRLPGFQPELVCLTPWINSMTPTYRITSLSVSSSAGLVAYGSENGLVIIDLIQKCCVLNVGTFELYGAADPYQRIARSQKKTPTGACGGTSSSKDNTDMSHNDGDRCKSPTEQINGVCLSPTSGKQQQQQSSSASTVVKKPITPEMKRTRSQGTRSILQKMHTIQSMASTDEGSVNYNLTVNQGSDKIDSSFSRSRSSSISSLDNITTEAVQCLTFADTYCTKSDATTGLCLYVGTSLGSVLAISLTLPDTHDNRILQLQSVIASPSGSIYRLKGSILCISFLDYSGALLQTNNESWKDANKTCDNTTPTSSSSLENKRSGSLTITRSGSGGSSGVTSNKNTKISPTSSATDMRDTQFVVLVSEKHVRIVHLPSQICSYKVSLTETSFAVRADVVYMKSADSVCLATYLGTGNIVVYSLPSLRLLIDIDFLPLVDVRIARTICFSNNGHGMYLSSASELTKFTISSSFRDSIVDMVGSLFIAKDMPEAPKPSFLKGLFGGGPSSVDREELFGESNAGKASKTTARHIPGSIDQMKTQTGTLGAELSRVREGLNERGERLNQIEDRTARMMAEADAFSSSAHNVMQKYRDKKWYQI